jgi:hypothetical protein
MVKKQGADIYFGDAAHIRSDHHAGDERGYAHRTSDRLSPWHEPDFGSHRARPRAVHDHRQGSVNVAVFIEFLKRLVKGAAR